MYYYSQDYTTVKVTSYYPFWKWRNFWHRTGTFFKIILYFLGPVCLIYGPLGLVSFFKWKAFTPKRKLNTSTGEIEVDTSYEINTLCSRVASLWTYAKASRTKFEELPDSGFLGKNVTRFFNRFWNYVCVGLIGSLFVLIFQPLFTLFNILICGFLFLASPIWIPLLSTFLALFEILFLNFQRPFNTILTSFVKFLFYFFLVLACMFAIFVLPCNFLSFFFHF